MSLSFDPAATNRLFRNMVGLVLGLVLFKALLIGFYARELLIVGDNDDMMRLQSIRDWLGGQSWFDMRQYRALPPEGLDMHWSRYVDLGIATILWPLMQILPVELAELITLIVWPTLLLIVLCLITVRTGRHLLGPMAGVAALLCLLIWSPIAQINFVPTRLDHHNVQILLMSVMVFPLIMPGHALRRGVISGLAAAVSLAIGLESLLVVAVTGLILVWRQLRLQHGSTQALLGFSVTLCVASFLLFAGQTPADQWMVQHCDVMALPFLALTVAGAAICAALVLATPRLPNLALRGAVFLVISAAVLMALSPLIGPCLKGPYGELPAAAQHIIEYRISEAKPGIRGLLDLDQAISMFVFPAYVIILAATGLWLRSVLRANSDPEERRAVGTLLIFGWLGLICSLFQARLMLMGACAVPLLAGYAMSPLMLRRQSPSGAPAPSIALVAGLAVLFVPPMLTPYVKPSENAAAVVANGPTGPDTGNVAQAVETSSCRKPEILETLNAVPPATILSFSNYGPPLLVLTHHSVLAAPYHRNPDALIDGVVPFDGEEQVMRDTLARTGADYLLLCRNAVYGQESSFATALASGTKAPGFAPVPGVHDTLLLLKVLKP